MLHIWQSVPIPDVSFQGCSPPPRLWGLTIFPFVRDRTDSESLSSFLNNICFRREGFAGCPRTLRAVEGGLLMMGKAPFFSGATAENATERLFRCTAAQRQSQGQTQLGRPNIRIDSDRIVRLRSAGRSEAVGKGSDQWSCTKAAEAEGSDWVRDVCGRVVSFATSAWACSSSLTVKM
jgi:hypothetical protein